ncbi:MAG TPA: hypothetical protein VH415_04010 [Nitrososphaeraceae archaeon]|jgi:hypothetical protein
MARYNVNDKSLSQERGKPIISPDRVDKTDNVSEGNQPSVTVGQDTHIDSSSGLERNVPIRTTISAKAKNKSSLIGFSRGALKDELIYQLSSSAKMDLKTFEMIDKYHEQAKTVLYRINLYDLSTVDIASTDSKAIFVIHTSDITKVLYAELEEVKRSDPRGFDELVTEAVQTILEGINKRYYHIAGLPYKITWRFEA